MSTYYAFRIFLVESNTNQKDLFEEESGFDKKESLKNTFITIREEGKKDFHYYGSRYLIYFLKTFTPQVYLFELAREKVFLKPLEGEKRIEEIEDFQYPHIYFLLDLERQILMIEHRSSVFQEIDSVKNILENFIEEGINNKKILVKVQEISSMRDFWRYIEESEGVYQFNMTLTGPNLFGGRFSASELVHHLNDEYNSNETNFSFSNKLGKLKVLKENFQEYIRLISSGGGKYFAKVKDKDGEIDTISSKTSAVKRNYNNIEDEDPDIIAQDLDEIDNINEE